MEKTCPVMSDNYVKVKCRGEGCAWWDGKRCGVLRGEDVPISEPAVQE